MNIKYTFLNKLDPKKTLNFGLFCDENFNILSQDKLGFLNQNLINKLIKNNRNLKKEILTINVNDKQNLILIKLKKNQKTLDNEKIGASLYDFIKANYIFDITFLHNNFANKKLD